MNRLIVVYVTPEQDCGSCVWVQFVRENMPDKVFDATPRQVARVVGAVYRERTRRTIQVNLAEDGWGWSAYRAAEEATDEIHKAIAL